MAHILIVEDEQSIRSLIASILTLEGHQVSIASNGNDAIQICIAAHIDLVITDLIMPEKEGLELMMELRKDHPSVKVIAMTGGGYGSAAEYLSFARALGAVKTLSKPFNRQELLDAVASALTV